MAMIIWIERPLAIAIHERQLAEHGGGIGVRDESLLDSTLARPQQRHTYGDRPPDLADLAASLAFGLARNHPFVDGNMRTAAVVCEAFIMLNGGALHADDLELYPRYLALAEGRLPEAEFATWLRQHIKLDATKRVNEPRARYAR
jgi:death-on-curing protein